MTAPNTAPLLAKLLDKQHQTRSPQLFKSGVFTLTWRSKVGSFPSPDLETLISAGEPCGRWDWSTQRTKDFGDLEERRETLPLHGYVPASAIRGIVRSWAMQQPNLVARAIALLGHQVEDKITAGKIEFLDAWTEQPSKLTLDVVNPQERFQVFHDGKTEPHALYTLGDGTHPVTVTIAIRGISGRVTAEEVNQVWIWIEQALGTYGVGGRTASGYGVVQSNQKQLAPGLKGQEFVFQLYSQGSAGPKMREMELRPSHWRGWLRSWTLRFLLGVMSERDAQEISEELFGTLESIKDGTSRQGSVRLQMLRHTGDKPWGEISERQDYPGFYTWQGKLHIAAPNDILEEIILPILRFAVSSGGVGRGWRRPLHIYSMTKRDRKTQQEYEVPSVRGTHLIMQRTTESGLKNLLIPPDAKYWTNFYQNWLKAVEKRWASKISKSVLHSAEVFSPSTCAVYLVPCSNTEPIDRESHQWKNTNGLVTRGSGMNLIYKPPYKRNPNVGGNATNGNSHCSWVSIRRVPSPSGGVKEVVCLFLGSGHEQRSQFLQELAAIEGAVPLFGVHIPFSSPLA